MMRVNANHGILLRVEFGIPAEHIESDAVFRDFPGLSIEPLVAQIFEQARKLRRAAERLRRQHGQYFSSALFVTGAAQTHARWGCGCHD
ncbi:MAG: hypothetical protein ABSH37_15055 [Bryobacteraceae bacterium]